MPKQTPEELIRALDIILSAEERTADASMELAIAEIATRDAEIAAEAYRVAAKLAWPISAVLADQIADLEKARP